VTQRLTARSGSQFAVNERPDIEALVPRGTQALLDVGCGTGRLGASLKALGIPRVVGVELNPEAADHARAALDEVVVTDVERDDLPFEDGSFDCIVYGDVLEHLTDPWTTLSRQRRLLTPDGAAIVSIPNVAYWRNVLNLARGRWEYTESGMLDATHLRFFTWSTIEQLLDQAGYRVERVKTPIGRASKSRLLNRITGGRLEHLLVWRYVVLARPA
jgi:2-polyprenyl-3-methyl-5-hydroxy-6-metoxy-1,4-benzoquinol methylase